MTKQQELRLSLSIVIIILITTGSVVGAHFMGIASAEANSKEYTDVKTREIKLEFRNKLDTIHQGVIDNGKSIIRLETKMER